MKYKKSDLIPFEYSGKWGYINNEGKVVIKPQYNYTCYFTEGLAEVELKKKWGFINQDGQFEIEPQYEYLSAFSRNRAWAHTKTSILLIDKRNTVIKSFSKKVFEDIDEFSCDLARFEKDELYGFMNSEGEIVIEPIYDEALHFSEDVAFVRKGNESFFINKLGEVVIESDKYECGVSFSDGLSNVTTNNRRNAYIDKNGEIIIKPMIGLGGSFSEGFATLFKYDIRKSGYINKEGSMIIEPVYESALNFINDVAIVELNGKSKIIDKSGNLVKEFDKRINVNLLSYQKFEDVIKISSENGKEYINRLSGESVNIEF